MGFNAFLNTTATGRELVDELLAAAVRQHGGRLPDDAALLLLEHDVERGSTFQRDSRQGEAVARP